MPTQLSAEQVATVDAILSIFETSTVRGDYGSVVFSPGDAGELTYGKHQTTLASGNLAKLVRDYVAAPNAEFKDQLAPYVPRLASRDSAPQLRPLPEEPAASRGGRGGHARRAGRLLSARLPEKPAFDNAVALGLADPLSWGATRYDGQVHGSWLTIAKRTDEDVGAIGIAGERNWMSTYVALRRQFLASGKGDLP